MKFILWICAAAAIVLLYLWGLGGFMLPDMPSEPPPRHRKIDVGDGCVLHYYSDPAHSTTKWVTCPSGETTTLDRKGCGKACSRDETVEVRKETKP